MTAKTVQFVRLTRIAKTGSVCPRFKSVRPVRWINPAICSLRYKPLGQNESTEADWVSVDDSAGSETAVFGTRYLGGADGGGKKILFHCGSREILDVTNSPT